MRIVLLRHGIAIARDHPDCPPEEERHLTAEGLERTTAVARGLVRLRLHPDRVLSSPWLRARQTAGLAAEALHFDPDSVEITEALLPSAPATAILEEIEARAASEVLLAGHAPHLDEVLAQLVGIGGSGGTSLKKAGAASIECTTIAPGAGRLEWMIPPRVLRAFGGA